MSAIDEVLRANASFAAGFQSGGLPMLPARKLAVVTCMDARLDVHRMLGLDLGEAHVVRNAGGIVTEDVLRSLIISHHFLGTQEFLVINHTECGMLTFRDEELLDELRRTSGASPSGPAVFHAFTNLEENVRQQTEKIRSHPWLPKSAGVRGCVYDVKTGRLHEVTAARGSGSR
ncbi:MAG TPA: carbonic anhydrase [Bryobacteraceae bacterium]